MECTQRLECTQELYESRSERVCPEQIGFLGICGVKHPVKRGPNKIGRDPQTCNIVLNLNSISRQHAVINVLNQREFMLMDLDSANKTKLMDKTLQPYIPHSLKDGDMVQFGDIFGVFRLLEDDNDLPMTQALDIPDTPISTRHVSKLNKAPITTIPESPDVSDRDDSFIAPSQPKNDKCFKNTNSNFVKPSSKVISIQPVGSNKIDNVYWSSSKRSVSLNSQFDDSGGDLNASTVSNKSKQNNNENINDMETQPFDKPAEKEVKHRSIFEMDTQPPIQSPNQKHMMNIYEMETQATTSIDANDSVDSIYTANTQIPNGSLIHSLDTQIPNTKKDKLPEVRKIDGQHEIQFDLFSTRKGNPKNIFDAETQPFIEANDSNKDCGEISKKLDTSNEEISFEAMETQNYQDNFDSQPLLPLEALETIEKDFKTLKTKSPSKIQGTENVLDKKENKVDTHSDSSTDCEDIAIMPTQKITLQVADDDDLTDCEDNITKPTQKIETKNDDDLTDCEDLFEDSPQDVKPKNSNKQSNIGFEDLLTQIIDENVVNEENIPSKSNVTNDITDMPTQVLDINEEFNPKETVNQKEVDFEDMPTQVLENDISEEVLPVTLKKLQENVDSPFKIPLISPIKVKRKDIKASASKEKIVPIKTSAVEATVDENDEDINYYAATQDILEDLCTQQDAIKLNCGNTSDEELVPCSVEEYKTGDRFPHLENSISPKKKLATFDKSSESSDGDEKVNKFVKNLTSQDIREVIGVGSKSVDKVKRVPSDLSDIELTPKKVRPIKFMDIDLPNSQEIKTSVSLYSSKTAVTESSSDSEVENNSEEQCTPIIFRRKKKTKVEAKVDLTKKFDVQSLPTRVITRVRKPTSKLQNSDEAVKKLNSNILKPKFFTEQEEEIDTDIINENISRLKTKNEKSKNKVEPDTKNKLYHTKDETKSDEKENSTNIETKSSAVDRSTESKDKTNTKSKPERTDSKKSTKETSKKSKKNEKSKKEDSKRKSDETCKKPAESKTLDKLIEDVVKTNVVKETNTRSTRNRRNVNKSKEKLSTSVEKDDSQSEIISKSKRRQPSNKKIDKVDLTIENAAEVRRSKRQRTSREKKEDKIEEKVEKPKKTALKKNQPAKHEQSTVYSISSGSGNESPMSMKRSATTDLDPPSPKRTRSILVSNNTSLRSTPARGNRTQYVLFTAFPSEEVKAKLEKLGAVIVSDVMACTMVLTLQIKRTFKLLCAVGLGRPIVGPNWVQACADTNMIVDPWLYVLKDEVAEKRFQFNLERILLSKRNFLSGYNVSSTPNVLPTAPEMKLIVECSGGTWKEGGPQWICVSCTADKALWPALKRKGATVVTTEFILGGVLRQRVDTTTNKL